jgi:hypothetical protein
MNTNPTKLISAELKTFDTLFNENDGCFPGGGLAVVVINRGDYEAIQLNALRAAAEISAKYGDAAIIEQEILALAERVEKGEQT